ncbi:hypothetical protein [Salimicrobium halophilum]|uniref:Uncharacterized protein n=1 Tax=Salimicrobium halophilum TaxID=86666 RepID=A0A1G8RIC2_9BACI|nr:hypothetical protein [Salimicrobium halophilum]SDJ16747.1 hypothetical protein SAMN04490247_1054 [Salimicrobium halophilum]
MLKIFDFVILPAIIVLVAVLLLDMPLVPALIGAYIGIWIALILRRKREEKHGKQNG